MYPENPNYEIYIYILFYIGGGGSCGTLTSNPGLPNFQGSNTSSQSRQMYNKKNISASFSYMGPNVKKCAFLAILFIFGGSWGALTSNPGLFSGQYDLITEQTNS